LATVEEEEFVAALSAVVLLVEAEVEVGELTLP